MLLTTLLLSAAVQAATPPAPPANPEKKVVREIVVLDGKDAKDAKSGEKKEIRRIVIREGGPGADGAREVLIRRNPSDPTQRLALVDCDKGSQVASDDTVTEKDGKKLRTKVLICAKGEPGDRLAALERVQKRIAEDKDLPAEARDRVAARLEAEIARLKTAKP